MIRYKMVVRVTVPRSAGSVAGAREAVRVVVGSLVNCLPVADRGLLLGTPFEQAVIPGWSRQYSGAALVLEVAWRTGRTPSQARHLLHAVFAALAQTSPLLGAFLRSRLSPDVLTTLAGREDQSGGFSVTRGRDGAEPA